MDFAGVASVVGITVICYLVGMIASIEHEAAKTYGLDIIYEE